jgi:hypothetical protein
MNQELEYLKKVQDVAKLLKSVNKINYDSSKDSSETYDKLESLFNDIISKKLDFTKEFYEQTFDDIETKSNTTKQNIRSVEITIERLETFKQNLLKYKENEEKFLLLYNNIIKAVNSEYLNNRSSLRKLSLNALPQDETILTNKIDESLSDMDIDAEQKAHTRNMYMDVVRSVKNDKTSTWSGGKRKSKRKTKRRKSYRRYY